MRYAMDLGDKKVRRKMELDDAAAREFLSFEGRNNETRDRYQF